MDSFGSSTILGQSDCTAHSVVRALDKFLKAVHQMRDIVMVPSRLKDMQAVINVETEPPTRLRTPVPKPSDFRHKHVRNLALTASLPMPSAQYASRTDECQATAQIDLFTFYAMLQVIRNELVCGSPSSLLDDVDDHGDDDVTSDDSQYSSFSSDDSTVTLSVAGNVELSTSPSKSPKQLPVSLQSDQLHAKKLAVTFKRHLSGLFHILQELTEGADFLAQKYQQEVNGSTEESVTLTKN